MQIETYRINKIYKDGHQWSEKIQGQSNMLDYVSKTVHKDTVAGVTVSFAGMQEEIEED